MRNGHCRNPGAPGFSNLQGDNLGGPYGRAWCEGGVDSRDGRGDDRDPQMCNQPPSNGREGEGTRAATIVSAPPGTRAGYCRGSPEQAPAKISKEPSPLEEVILQVSGILANAPKLRDFEENPT